MTAILGFIKAMCEYLPICWCLRRVHQRPIHCSGLDMHVVMWLPCSPSLALVDSHPPCHTFVFPHFFPHFLCIVFTHFQPSPSSLVASPTPRPATPLFSVAHNCFLLNFSMTSYRFSLRFAFPRVLVSAG